MLIFSNLNLWSLYMGKKQWGIEMFIQSYFKYLKCIKIQFMYLKLSSQIGTDKTIYFLEHGLLFDCLQESDANKAHFIR